jgi:hypothetical protein
VIVLLSAVRCAQGQCEAEDEAADPWHPAEDFVVLPACADDVDGVMAADVTLLRSVLERGPGQEPLWRLLQRLLDCTEPIVESFFSDMAQDDVLAMLRAYLASHPGRSKVVIVRGGAPGMSYDEVVGAWLGSPAYESGQRLLIMMDTDSSGDFLDRLRDDPRNPDLRLAIHGSCSLGEADADGPSFLRQMLTAPQVGRDPTTGGDVLTCQLMRALRQCSQDDDTSEEGSEGWEEPREYLVMTPSEAHAEEPGSQSVMSADLTLLRRVLERGPGREPLWRLLQLLLDCREPLAEFSSLQEPHADVLTRLRAYLASDTWRSKVVIICEDLGLNYDDVVGAWLGSSAYESGQRLLIVMDADSSGDFLDRLRDDPRNPDLRLAIHGSRRLGGADDDGPSFLRQMLTAPQVRLDWCTAVPRGWVLTQSGCVHGPLQDHDMSKPGEGDEPGLLEGITDDVTKVWITPVVEDAAAGASPWDELEMILDDTPLPGEGLMAEYVWGLCSHRALPVGPASPTGPRESIASQAPARQVTIYGYHDRYVI